jgi:hypothetical protein
MRPIFETIADEKTTNQELIQCWLQVSEQIFTCLQDYEDKESLQSLLLAERLISVLLS